MDLALDDFKDPSDQLTFADFQGNAPKGSSINERTAAQLAGGDTVLTSGSIEDYRKTKDQLLDPESREQFVLKQQNIRDNLFNDAKSSLVDTLSSPSIPDGEKLNSLIASKISVEKLPPLSTLDTLAEEAAIADSGDNETERASNSRFNALDSIKRMNSLKREITSAVNSLKLGQDSSTLRKVREIGELIVPFAESVHVKDVIGDITGTRPNVIKPLGESKKQLFSLVGDLPIDQIPAFTERVLQIIEENPGVILPDGNDIANLDILNRMFITNDYSDTERWFDNIVSVLDGVGAGSLIKSFVKGGKGSKVGTKLGREANAFKNRPKEAVTPLEEEALAFKSSQDPVSPLEEEALAFKSSQDPVSPLEEEAKAFSTEKEPTADTLFRRALNEDTRTEVPSTAPSQIIKDVNPELARSIHKLAAEDDTGEAAKALYGATKEEALAKDLLPEPDIRGGKVPNKVEMRRQGPEFEEPADIRKVSLTNGNTDVSLGELAKVREKLLNGLSEIEGMILHPSSMLFRTNLDRTTTIVARFSPTDSGFSTAQEALNRAQFAFRNYRINPDEFKILVRNGDEWVPTTLKEVEAKEVLKRSKPNIKDDVPELDDVDFAIGLEYNYRFSPEDLQEVDLLTTAPGYIARTVQLLDRLPTQFFASLGQGSIVQHILDVASVIHPQIANAISVAVDKSHALKKLYVKEFEKFSKSYSKLDKNRRALITDYINEANRDGLRLDTADLYSRGFNQKEVEVLREWRRANDIMFHANNRDAAKTIRFRGGKMFVHNGSDTKFVGRPIARKSLEKGDTIFDMTQDSVVKFDGTDLDKLYDEGGTLVRLDQPIQADGQWIDVVVARNTPEGGFTREIYDGEQVLAYRDGYYPVVYDANFFIEKVIKVNGKERHKVVASARDNRELDEALEMLRKDDPDATFSFRKDRSLNAPEARLFDDGAWSLYSNSGLTTQRFRGERLGDAGVNLNNLGTAHLKDPLEAVSRQIIQLSNRVAMRDVMDSVKKRWLLNYGDFIELPRNKKTGQLEMPSLPSQIKGKPGAPAKLVADARSNFNYLYGLENGYINGIDSTLKATLHLAADIFGEHGLPKLERLSLEAARVSPVQQAKTLAFKLFLSASPVRQSILQRGQIILLNAIHPKYVSTNLIPDLIRLDMARLGSKSSPKHTELFREIENTGILEAVDSNSLTRTDMLRLADLTASQKAKTLIGQPFKLSQKIGFDFAEQDNLIAAWLVQRDLAIKAGKNTKDQRVADEILGQARAFTLSMNRAGEFPYSQNTLGFFAQFLSFRHKIFLQTLTNRSLTPIGRAKLLAFTTAMFGADATIISTLWNKISDGTEPSEIKDNIQDGLLDFALNSALSAATGTEQAIDFGDLAPSEAFGMWNMISGMFSTDLGEIIANAPAGSLVFGNNARLTDAFKTGMRYFNIIDDYEDPELQTTFPDVAMSLMSTLSGVSATFKARYAFHHGQKLSSYGRITDDQVTKTEAVAAAFGFRTKTETGFTEVKKLIFGERSFENDDVVLWYNELKRQLSRRGTTVIENDLMQRTLAEAHRVFSEDRPRFLEILKGEIEKDATNGDFAMFKSLTSRMGLIPKEDMWKMINTLPAGNLRDQLTALVNTSEELLNGN